MTTYFPIPATPTAGTPAPPQYITVLQLRTTTATGHVRIAGIAAPDGSVQVLTDLDGGHGRDGGFPRRVAEAVDALRRRFPRATVDAGDPAHLGRNPMRSPALTGYVEHVAAVAPRNPAPLDGPAVRIDGESDAGRTLIVVTDATVLDIGVASLGVVATDGTVLQQLTPAPPGTASIRAELAAAELALTQLDIRCRRILLMSDCIRVAEVINAADYWDDGELDPAARSLADTVHVLRAMGVRVEACHRHGHRGTPATEMSDAVARHGVTRALDEPLGMFRLSRLAEFWRRYLSARRPDAQLLSEAGAWSGLPWMELFDVDDLDAVDPFGPIAAILAPVPEAPAEPRPILVPRSPLRVTGAWAQPTVASGACAA